MAKPKPTLDGIAPAKLSIERPTEQIKIYIHCARCLQERPENQSPMEWARLNVGWTDKGIQVWCTRHNLNVMHIDLLGQKVEYTT